MRETIFFPFFFAMLRTFRLIQNIVLKELIREERLITLDGDSVHAHVHVWPVSWKEIIFVPFNVASLRRRRYWIKDRVATMLLLWIHQPGSKWEK